MSDTFTGKCLCGQVAYRISGPFETFHWCHCSRCRRDTGSSHASNLFTRPEDIEWLSGAEHVKRFDLPEAERYAKAFCTGCGSPVPYVTRNGARLVVPAGTLDGDPGIKPQDNIHWDSRAPWYEDGLEAERFPEDPPG